MRITIESPSKALVEASEAELKSLRKQCEFKNTGIEHQLKRHKNNIFWKNRQFSSWDEKRKELEEKVYGSVLLDENGKTYIRPGFISYLEGLNIEIQNNIKYPNPRPFPWYRKLKYEPYPYQIESVRRLLEQRHGSVELATGSGKTFIIIMLAQKLGLKTVVITPFASIFNEMLEEFKYYFGDSAVGAFGDGKKKLGKKFTICVSDSIANIKPGSKEWQEISSAEVLIGDEAHTIASETLEKMAYGVLKNIPYRFFLTGTKTRGDGTEKLLFSIVSNTVYELSTAEALSGGYIANHEYRIVPVESTKSTYKVSDGLAMKRVHFLSNTNIANFIAKTSNVSAQLKNYSSLVLVSELSQVISLIPKIGVSVAIASSTNDTAYILSSILDLDEKKLKKSLKENPEALNEILNSMSLEQRRAFDLIKNSTPLDAVEKFNKGEAKVLIGTSCISTGVNLFPTHLVFNWVGGSSEILTRQGAVGRSVRKLENSKYKEFHPPKEKSIIFDFDVVDIETMERHLKQRIGYYKLSGTPIVRINNG